MQSLEGELLARVNRDCYFDRTFHKTHVHTTTKGIRTD